MTHILRCEAAIVRRIDGLERTCYDKILRVRTHLPCETMVSEHSRLGDKDLLALMQQRRIGKDDAQVTPV